MFDVVHYVDKILYNYLGISIALHSLINDKYFYTKRAANGFNNLFMFGIDSHNELQITTFTFHIGFIFTVGTKYLLLFASVNDDTKEPEKWRLNVSTLQLDDISNDLLFVNKTDKSWRYNIMHSKSHVSNDNEVMLLKFDNTADIFNVATRQISTIQLNQSNVISVLPNQHMNPIVTLTSNGCNCPNSKTNKKIYYNGNECITSTDRIDLVMFSGKFIYYTKRTTTKRYLIKYNTITHKKHVLYKTSHSFSPIEINSKIIGVQYEHNNEIKWKFFKSIFRKYANLIKNASDSTYFKIIAGNKKYIVLNLFWLNKSDNLSIFVRSTKQIISVFEKYDTSSFTVPFEKPIDIPASDGLIMPSYILFPNDVKPPFSTIIYIHGGPIPSEHPVFNPTAKCLGLMGFCVVRLNYRGSNVNQKFRSAAHGELSNKMISDIHDTAKFLIKEGIADKNNIGLYGFSWGATFALMATISKPKLYKFAICNSGLVDVKKYYNKNLSSAKQQAEYIKYFPSNIIDDAIDPTINYDKIKANILLISGDLNYFGNHEYEQLVKDIGNNAKLLLYKNEGHIIRKRDNLVDMWTNIRDFLQPYHNT